jgi:hypothetical protein
VPFSSVSGKPSCSIFLCSTVTSFPSPFCSNSFAASSARCSWNSNVWTWPVGAIARANDVVSDPEPVPDSKTMDPGFNSSWQQIVAISAR